MRLHTLAVSFYPLAAMAAMVTYPAPYSYGFVEPEPPLINTDYTANFMQVGDGLRIHASLWLKRLCSFSKNTTSM